MNISLLDHVRARRLQPDEAGVVTGTVGTAGATGATGTAGMPNSVRTRVLLVAATMSAASLLRHALWDRDLSIDVVPARDARWTLERHPNYDLVVLDLLSSGSRGDLVCRHVRDAGTTRPILVLGIGYPSEDPPALFDAGADGYIAEPIDLEELRARVDALLRRAALRLVRATPG